MGDYTVKSGYRLVVDLVGDFANGVVQGDWRALWYMKVPPKDVEHTWHTFVDCPFARDCWRQAKLLNFVDLRAANALEFPNWFFACVQNLSGLALRKWVMVIWAIWKQRNAKLWQASSQRNQFCTPSPSCPQSSSGSASPSGFFKWLTKEKLWVCLKLFHGFVSLGYSRMIFEIDAKTVFDAIKNPSRDLSEFGGIVQRCRLCFDLFPNFSISFVRRQANDATHVLARQSRFHASPTFWSVIPPFLGDLVIASVDQFPSNE